MDDDRFIVAVFSIFGLIFGLWFLVTWPNKPEAVLLGILLMGVITATNQIYYAKVSGIKFKDNGVNPFDHLFTPMPEGTFSANQPYRKAFAWFGAIVGLMGWGWVAVNVPELRDVALVYLIMGIVVMVVVLTEEISPTKSQITACMLTGYGDYEEQVLAGILLAIPFVAINIMRVLPMQAVILQVKGMPIASFILTAIMVPTIEEALFRGVIAPSIAEDAGVIHGAVISAFIFAMFHAFVYRFDWTDLFLVFVFGVASAMVDFKYKSILPSTVAHVIINASAMLA